MQNFSNQCLDLARSLLGNNLKHLNPDGTVSPAPGEQPRADEPGHAALAIGEFFRASGEVELERSIEIYERGAALRAHCDSKLKAAELKVEKIVRGEDGQPATEPAGFD